MFGAYTLLNQNYSSAPTPSSVQQISVEGDFWLGKDMIGQALKGIHGLHAMRTLHAGSAVSNGTKVGLNI